MGETVLEPEGGSGGDTVVVTAPAPAYVTAGELDAKIELLRVQLSTDFDQRVSGLHDRVSMVQEDAYQAQDAANDAKGEADLALDIAADLAEKQEEPESGESGSTPKGDSNSAVDGDDTPSAPSRRKESTEDEGAAKKDRSPWKGLWPKG